MYKNCTKTDIGKAVSNFLTDKRVTLLLFNQTHTKYTTQDIFL